MHSTHGVAARLSSPNQQRRERDEGTLRAQQYQNDNNTTTKTYRRRVLSLYIRKTRRLCTRHTGTSARYPRPNNARARHERTQTIKHRGCLLIYVGTKRRLYTQLRTLICFRLNRHLVQHAFPGRGKPWSGVARTKPGDAASKYSRRPRLDPLTNRPSTLKLVC